jgi:hypothetical protein
VTTVREYERVDEPEKPRDYEHRDDGLQQRHVGMPLEGKRSCYVVPVGEHEASLMKRKCPNRKKSNGAKQPGLVANHAADASRGASGGGLIDPVPANARPVCECAFADLGLSE